MIVKLNYRLLSVCAGLVAAAVTACFAFALYADASAPKGEGVYLPVLMYHHVLRAQSAQGKYTVSPDEVRADLLTLQKNGYTTVFVSDLVAYVRRGTPLPEKPCMVTFDDGYETVLAYILPILRELDAKAVVSVVGAYTDLYSGNIERNLSYSNLNWDEVAALAASGHVEIQNHSYDMHDRKGARHGCRMAAGETDAQYVQALEEDIRLNQQKIKRATGVEPVCFTYPFGYMTRLAEQTVRRMGFQATLSCAEGLTFIQKGNPECLYRIKRYNRPHGADGLTAKILDKAARLARQQAEDVDKSR